ncbi:MAG: serine--tRNA ligase [Planctomycetota bacterium]
MFDPRLLREHPEIAHRACALKRMTVDVDAAHALACRRPAILQELEALRAEKNRVSEEIAAKKKAREDASARIEAMKAIGPRLKALEEELADVEERLQGFLLAIPNLPHESVAEGGEEANREIARWGEKPAFDFEPKPHWELGETLGILDLPRGAKLAGSGFPLYRGLGARLERALVSFFLDLHTQEHGFLEWFPPFLVNRAAMTGTGQLPRMEEEMYGTDKGEDLFLIPTAEVPVTNIHRNEILDGADLPLYYAAYSACFRREAGAAGKDTRGVIRVHQFNKVELVKFCAPERSWDELDSLRQAAETVLRRLGLHYRVVELASADLSFASAKCYDLEVWAPGVGKYLEVSSCSCFTDFQARRSGIRFRDADGQVRFVHTLNASGVACPRAWIAIVESFQEADGSVRIPKVLRPYMGGLERIAAR